MRRTKMAEYSAACVTGAIRGTLDITHIKRHIIIILKYEGTTRLIRKFQGIPLVNSCFIQKKKNERSHGRGGHPNPI